jgi:hypothetical protein
VGTCSKAFASLAIVLLVVLWRAIPSGAAPTLPTLRLIAPADTARLKNPVTLTIETPGDIKAMTMGGGTAGMPEMGPQVHLHITVDNRAFMPSASQLTKVGSSRYTYRLPPLPAGKHTIKVYWANNTADKPVGPVQSVTCFVG